MKIKLLTICSIVALVFAITVTFTFAAPNTENDIDEYKFEKNKNDALSTNINGDVDDNSVGLTVPYGTDVTNLIATFTLSDGATAKIGDVAQVSKETANNFTDAVIYTITAEDDSSQSWVVTVVSIAAPNNDATLSALTLSEGTLNPEFNPAVISYNVVLPSGTTDVPTVVVTTTTDSNASKKITQAKKLTGSEKNRTATVLVTAEDGTKLTYEVIFSSINVTISKTGSTTANQGDDITYTITYKNEGTFSATNVVVTETYPVEVEYVSANPEPDSGFDNKWTIGTLAPNGEGTIIITVHIK